MTPGTVRVELDVFSGRPNPVWPLTPAQVRELMTRLRSLRPGGGAAPQGLGFRGFLLHRMDPRGGSRPWLRVSGGTVTMSTAPPRVYRDTAGIEEWLRQQARDQGFGRLMETGPD